MPLTEPAIKKIKTGLIGYGMAGKVFHAPLISSNPSFELTAVVERTTDESRKKYPWIHIVKDIDQVLQNNEIDLIVIATPNTTHFDIAKRSLLADKHVVVDKPFTVTSSEAQDLIDVARKKNKIISVFQNRRWDGDFLTVKKIVEQRSLGRLVEFESHMDRYVNFMRESPWKESDEKGNGLLYDLGSHLIDQAHVLFGLPDAVYADMGTRRDGGKIIDHFEIIFYYVKMKVILRSGLLVREAGARFTLHGTEGSFVKYGVDPQEEMLKRGSTSPGLDWGKDSPEFWGKLNTQINGEHVVKKKETENGDYPAYYENIYNAITGKEELIVKPEEGRNTICLIETALLSSSEKRVIPFVSGKK